MTTPAPPPSPTPEPPKHKGPLPPVLLLPGLVGLSFLLGVLVGILGLAASPWGQAVQPTITRHAAVTRQAGFAIQGERYAVGDAIESGTLRIRVSDVSFPSGAGTDKMFVNLEVSVENLGPRPIGANGQFFSEMSLIDASGQVYGVQAVTSSAVREIAPGMMLELDVGFDVPMDATDLTFAFDGSAFDGGMVYIALP